MNTWFFSSYITHIFKSDTYVYGNFLLRNKYNEIQKFLNEIFVEQNTKKEKNKTCICNKKNNCSFIFIIIFHYGNYR